MAEPRLVSRSGAVRVKLAPDMIARLEVQACDFGIPVPTLCAYAIAAWVKGQETNSKLAQAAMSDLVRLASEQSGQAIEPKTIEDAGLAVVSVINKALVMKNEKMGD